MKRKYKRTPFFYRKTVLNFGCKRADPSCKKGLNTDPNEHTSISFFRILSAHCRHPQDTKKQPKIYKAIRMTWKVGRQWWCCYLHTLGTTYKFYRYLYRYSGCVHVYLAPTWPSVCGAHGGAARAGSGTQTGLRTHTHPSVTNQLVREREREQMGAGKNRAWAVR